MDILSSPEVVLGTRKVPAIETYPTRMMFSFIEKRMIIPKEENSVFVICSSYIERLEHFYNELPQGRRLLFCFDDRENDDANGAFPIYMAYEIKKLVETNPAAERIYVCCDNGQSRSIAIVCALYRHFGNANMEKLLWNSPHNSANMLVYKRMCGAFDIEISDREINELQHIRDSAFADALINRTQITRELYRYGINSRVSDERKLEYFDRLYAYDGRENISWRVKSEKYELSADTGDYELMALCRDIAINSLEFVWFYGLYGRGV